MYKLKLTPNQIECLIHHSSVYGPNVYRKAFQDLVSKGLYRKTNDTDPHYVRTTEGDLANASLRRLVDLKLI